VLQPGAEILPSYHLIVRLGKGGFGEVWKAAAPGGVPVALKLLRRAANAAVESRALAFMKFVNHPHLLSIFGIWHSADFLIIGMELADRTLMDRLCEARSLGQVGVPFEELIEYMREAAKAIDFLNAPRHLVDDRPHMRIIHRDIKPSNLLLVGGSVKVGDVGLARVLESSLGTATIALTPAYAPPEFFLGQITPYSDQYSLAISYCQLRGGNLPFPGEPFEVVGKSPNPLPDLRNLAQRERQAVARALAQHPQDRWPNCRTFVQQLLEGPQPGRVAADYDWSSVVLDTTPLAGGLGRVHAVRYTPTRRVCEFLAEVFNLVADHVRPFTYGRSWVLRETATGRVLDVGTPWARRHGVAEDERPLRDVGIAQGVRLETIPLAAHR
jgi:serine/threonine protein kinase